MTKCIECGNEIVEFSKAWQKVEGWARPRGGGGTNALALRRPMQEFMCPECMIHAKLFGTTQQETLPV